MKILNLFAGIGGNRTLWGDQHEITAIEYDPEIANIYKQRFPNDVVIIEDAYNYFLENFHNFEMIWGSPPCTTHTRLTRTHVGQRYNKTNIKLKLPDLRLYSIIIFLKEHFRGHWIIENVKGYYKPLIQPTNEIGRHWIWTNITLLSKKKKTKDTWTAFRLDKATINDCCKMKQINLDFSKISLTDSKKKQIINNCVDPEFGKYILDSVINKKQKTIMDKWK